MKTFTLLLMVLLVGALGCACRQHATSSGPVVASGDHGAPGVGVGAPPSSDGEKPPMDDITPPPDEVPKLGTVSKLTDADWKKRLTPRQYNIMREAGTEPPNSGAYVDYHGKGVYHCSACNAPLFRSDTKFHSGTGWPSFFRAIAGRVGTRVDRSLGMVRTEVYCKHCGAHLGHLFHDGPKPTGLRYCIDSLALYFRKS